MLTPKPNDDLGKEKVFKKLGKSLIAYKDIKCGEKISLDHLSGRIFKTQYIPVRESNKVIGALLSTIFKRAHLLITTISAYKITRHEFKKRFNPRYTASGI